MKILDLFCGAGGAGHGYALAGHEVTGIDIDPQPNYPYNFHREDALEFIKSNAHEFDFIHASPPCQGYSTGVSSASSKWVPTKGKDEPRLISEIHRLMLNTGKPWVIENVYGARNHMPDSPIMLCGSQFGMKIPRHRMFSTSFKIQPPPHPSCKGLAKRSSEELGWDYRDMSVTGKGRHKGTSQRWAQLLGIDWHMTQHDLSEAIPPAYTHWIAEQYKLQP